MTKTLLFLNGQPVILTSNGTDSLVHDNAALATGAEGHGGAVSQDDPKSLFHAGTAGKHSQASGSMLSESENLTDSIRSNLVQVRVNGREVPGFMLSEDKAGSVQKIVGHSVNQQKIEYGLVSSEKNDNVDGPEKLNGAESGGFFQLHSAPVQRVISKDSNFTDACEESCGSDMFALAANAEIVHSHIEGRTGVGSQEEGSVENVQNIVNLPIVSNQMQVEGHSVNVAADQSQVIQVGTEENQVQPRNLSAIVAIIQGEDGSSQTIELSPEEACKLNLPQFLGGSVTTQQQLIHHPPVKIEELSTAHSSLPDDQKSQITEVDSNSEGLEGGTSSVFPREDRSDEVHGNGSCGISANDAGDNDVNLGPFLLIPEYNADGSISMLQIRSSDSVSTTEVQTAENLNPNSVSVNNSHLCQARETNEMSLSFPRPIQNIPKINLPMNSNQQMKNPSNIKPKYIDWKTLAPKSVPKVSGSMYLRDIAKRTKFRDLTSFLGVKQTQQDCEVTSKNHVIESVTPSSSFSGSVAGLSRAVNISPQSLVMSSATGFTLGSSSGLLQSQSQLTSERRATTPVKVDDVSLHLSHHPSSDASVLCNENIAGLHQEPVTCGDRALTIKVSTGPIYVTGSTISTTASSTIPAPSIKCVGGDETPFTVHLPGGDNTKPLGSSENPIQLVQQGNTFQALQPVQERQLEQITALLQQRRITAPPTTHHDEIYDPKTNMKIVYKVVFPEDILHADDEDDENVCGKDDITWEARTGSLEEKRRGRKPKDWRKLKQSEEEEVDNELLDESEERKKPISRTRSGRISRPPRHMMKDFKHLHPISFSDDDRDKDTHSFGSTDYDELHRIDSEKKPGEPVIIDLPRRKKREMPPLTRLRYTCLTCDKLYMGRIEAHYRKFPDHRREHPLSPSDLKQSYSAIKTLSDSSKPSTDGGSEINKSVLSPTPGTQASETSGEPSLPMETLTTQPIDMQTSSHIEHQLNQQNPQFDLPAELNPVKPGRGRGRRGRRGQRSRGRGAKFGGSGRPAAAASQPPALAVSPINMLEKILSGYSSEEIQNAVGKRLVQNLTPWQLLCFQIEGKETNNAQHSWQDRFHKLRSLLMECKEEFQKQMEPLQSLKNSDCQDLVCDQGDCSLNGEQKHCDASQKSGELGQESDVQQSSKIKEEPSGSSDDIFLSSDDATSKSCIAKEFGNMDKIKVCDYIASVLGVTGGVYRQKRQAESPSSPIPCNINPNSGSSEENNEAEMKNPSTVKRQLEMDDVINDTSPKRIQGDRPGSDEVDQKSSITHSTNQSGCCNISGIAGTTYPKKVDGDSVDSVGKVLSDVTHNMDLSSYNLPAQITSGSNVSPSQLQTSVSTSSMLTTSERTTSMSTCLSPPHFSIPLSNERVTMSGTTLTMSHTAPCVTHTSPVTSASSSLPLEVPHFASHNNNSVSTISSCIPMSSMDTSLMPTSTIPQVNTIQQMPLSDLDITAEDLPRLLSEGTGLVVGGSGDGGDTCDAPKLLDTSGDTTDLSEMLFKLQEATAGISQNQDPNLGPPVYHEHILTSSQQMNANSSQLMTSQSLATNSEVLNTQGYSTVGQTLHPHSAPNLSLKLDTSQASSEPSMPRLTFTGALGTNSDFHSTSASLSQPVSTTESSGKEQQNALNQASVQGQNVSISQNEAGLDTDRERLNIGFNVTGLGSTEFEDLLKR
ncbi:uncharacterized protein [Panulirus ornatus]|uniref:uncharacterized protein isoform X2 n=1 Tax=Panulirus ornatus TaxID=150431 RepID=UPI003A8B4CC8